MASELGYNTNTKLRDSCGDVPTQDFSDTHLDEILSKWEVAVHKAVGKSITSPWISSDENYKIVQQAVLFGSKSQVYEEMDAKDAESTKAFERYEYWLGLLKDAEEGSDSSGSFEDTVGIDGFVAI